MKRIVPILFLALFSCVSGQEKINCDKYNAEYIPVDLYDAIDYMDCTWSAEDKDKFRKIPEEEAVVSLHFGTGLGIRNSWGLWQGENELVKFFHSNNIFHPDDISSIIITSFHRKLNNKEIDFESQVQYYLDYWKPINDCEERRKERALEIYEKYNTGDTLTILMPVNDNNNAVLYGCPKDDWDFNPENDLRIIGVIDKKYNIGNEENVFFDIKLIELNRNDIKILMEVVDIDSIVKFHLKEMTIEKYNR